MAERIRPVWILIHQKFDTQADFALAVGEAEARVSRILRGRQRLTPERAAKWAEVLDCKPKALSSVIR